MLESLHSQRAKRATKDAGTNSADLKVQDKAEGNTRPSGSKQEDPELSSDTPVQVWFLNKLFG